MFTFARPLATLVALASVSVSSLACASAQAGPYSLELLDESGTRLPTFNSGGRTYVLGSAGRRYSLRIRNQSGRRVEFVAAVDGRDVLDGQPSTLDKRGYVVNPYSEVDIDGFRLSDSSVAAFRFGTVDQSYAARMGDARDVWVIGVGVFTEYQPPPPPRPVYRRYYGYGYDDRAKDLMAPFDGAPASPSAEGQLNAFDDAPTGHKSAESARGGDARPGLGTQFGEQRYSQAFETTFVRASSSPRAMLSVRYDDRPGLLAMGVQLDPRPYPYYDEARVRESAQAFRRDPGYADPPPGWNGY